MAHTDTPSSLLALFMVGCRGAIQYTPWPAHDYYTAPSLDPGYGVLLMVALH